MLRVDTVNSHQLTTAFDRWCDPELLRLDAVLVNAHRRLTHPTTTHINPLLTKK